MGICNESVRAAVVSGGLFKLPVKNTNRFEWRTMINLSVLAANRLRGFEGYSLSEKDDAAVPVAHSITALRIRC